MAAMKQRLQDMVDTMCNMEMQSVESVVSFFVANGYTDAEIKAAYRQYMGLDQFPSEARVTGTLIMPAAQPNQHPLLSH